MRITPTYRPNQTELSVQDASPNLTLPETITHYNEEFRRLRLKGTPAVAKVEEVVTPTPSTPTVPIVEPFDESVLHNSTLVIGDQVKRFNFIDSPSVTFEVTGTNVGGKQQGNIKAKVKEPLILTGIITIDLLPFTPLEMGTRYPLGTPSDKQYEMEYYTYSPINAKYGWMCYQVLYHGFNLTNFNDYDMDIKYIGGHYDLKDFSSYGLDGSIIFNANRHFENRIIERITHCDHRGLDANNIILHAPFKPDIQKERDLPIYQGFWGYDGYHEWLDAGTHQIVTDLKYEYTLTKGE
jgi:hypothetical protein